MIYDTLNFAFGAEVLFSMAVRPDTSNFTLLDNTLKYRLQVFKIIFILVYKDFLFLLTMHIHLFKKFFTRACRRITRKCRALEKNTFSKPLGGTFGRTVRL